MAKYVDIVMLKVGYCSISGGRYGLFLGNVPLRKRFRTKLAKRES